MSNVKIAYVGATPAYYFIPFIKKLSESNEVSLDVYWGCDESLRDYKEMEFGVVTKAADGLLDGYNYFFLKNTIGRETYQKGFFGLNSIQFFSEFRKKKYDYVIVHGWQYLNNIFAIIAAKLYGAKLLLRSESPLNQELEKSKLKLAIKKPFLKFLFKFVSGYLYIGKQNYEFYKYYGVEESDLFFTPYSVDNEKIECKLNRLPSKEMLRGELGLDPSVKYILFVGKLTQKKRPMIIMEALKKLNDKKIGVIYVGSGEKEVELKTFAINSGLKNIFFAGYKSQDELPRYYKSADLFVLPSGDGETWGLVTNEALVAGLPIILSDRVGSTLDLVRSENGLVFKLDDPIDLSLKIDELIKKGSLELKGKISKKIADIYSPDAVVKGILSAVYAKN